MPIPPAVVLEICPALGGVKSRVARVTERASAGNSQATPVRVDGGTTSQAPFPARHPFSPIVDTQTLSEQGQTDVWRRDYSPSALLNVPCHAACANTGPQMSPVAGPCRRSLRRHQWPPLSLVRGDAYA